MNFVQIANTVITIVNIAKPIIEDIAPKLNESLKGFANRLLKLSEKYPSIEDFAKVIKKASDIIGDVLFAFGINAEPSDVTGVKVAKSDKTIDDFDSVEAYINHLKNDIALDKDEFEKLNHEEKIAYSIIGLAIEVGAVAEKLGIEIPAEMVEIFANLIELKDSKITPDEIIAIIKNIKENGIKDLGDIVDFLKGSGESDRLKTGEVLSKVMNDMFPGNGDAIINDAIDELRK